MPSPMHTFDTPEAISVDLNVEFGGARIIARDRKTTVVEVRPMSEGRRADIEAAKQTRVRYAGGRLEVGAPKPRGLSLFGRPGAVDVVVQLPSGSHVRGNTGYGDFDAEGRLGDCFLKTSYGTLHVEDVGALTLQTSAGDITAGRVAGGAEIRSSSGDIRIGETSALANLKTSAGDIRVESAGESINARTAYGAIRVGHALRGQLDLAASYGDVEVGVAEGTATFLELRSNHGRVRNELDLVDEAPEPGEFLKVHAETGYGDIRIRRA
jgi:Putative adhesin